MFILVELEARLQPNIGFTFERALTMFTRSDITSPKVNVSELSGKHSKLWEIYTLISPL